MEMQIGEFAKICGTKISVLRHYDKEGLLVPDEVDRFTGYRYYAKEQIDVFFRITALKKAGFSLTEIREILAGNKEGDALLALFQKKESELRKTLRNLKEAKNMITGTVHGKEKRTNDMATLHENTDLPFENDESVVGKWQIIGEFASKEDFYAGRTPMSAGVPAANVYFLPGGMRYWCYGWTKNKLLIQNGDTSSVNDFTTESIGGKYYMFVDFKSYEYRHSGQPTVLVLCRLDNTAYSKEELAKKDDICKEFVPDERILGKWKSVAYCSTKQEFDPKKQAEGSLFFSGIEFQPGGKVISDYDHGKRKIGEDMQEWTKGFVLRKWNSTACAYELQPIDGTEYLWIEWKSGDYIYGGFDTDYYVFVRA